jgi:hypothetical protein
MGYHCHLGRARLHSRLARVPCGAGNIQGGQNMSADIRKYEAPKRAGTADYAALSLTAMGVGQEKRIVFNIDGYEAQLSTPQLLDLIATIARRLNSRKGFCATGPEQDVLVAQDGTIIIEQEGEA